MTLKRSAALVIIAVLLLALAGAWWYFFGPNLVPAAKLVPGDTLVFATIPNAVSIGTGYETSNLKKIADSPNLQPVLDELTRTFGPKNLELLKLLLPDLSGQSFIALTHFDPSKPDETGFVAGLKPKPGLDNFETFVQQVNASYPDLLRETKTGKGNLLGVDYQWIQGANSPGRICVARYHGWIVTAWGEASLQDWIERMQGKPATPSLAENADYQKSLDRIGKDAQAVLYLNYHDLATVLAHYIAASQPLQADYLNKKIASIGGAAVGSRFESGDIVDRFSVLQPRQAQLDNGMAAEPCAFDTLKFTGPNTRFYFGANLNWHKFWQSFQAQMAAGPSLQPLVNRFNLWAKNENIDVQKNIIDALGSEYSVQMEWDPDSTYPDLGLFLKVDKPDDFKPAIAALIDTMRRDYSTTAVITEMSANGHNYATLKTVQPMPVAPTITEDGPYLGLFLNEQHAVRSFARDAGSGLLHNDDFNRQIGDRRNGASEIIFLDSPALLDHAYRTALPFVSMAAMFNPTLASVLKDRQLPPDLSWLAPIDTWSLTVKADDDGITGYSTSGIGNQGIFLASGMGASFFALESLGFLPRHGYTTVTTSSPAPVAPPVVPGLAPANPIPAPAVAPANAASNSAPADAGVPAAGTATNAVPAATNLPPDTYAVPPGSATAPTNSDATSVPPATPPLTTH